MNMYTGTHRYYCRIDLHARFMYLCIVDGQGQVVYHKNHRCTPDEFLAAIAPFREEVVVGVECVFCWYWLADLCQIEGIDFILGHALYMKLIYGGKTKNDCIDSLKIARLEAVAALDFSIPGVVGRNDWRLLPLLRDVP